MESEKILSRDEVFLKNITEAVLNNLENEQFGVTELSDAVAISRFQLHRKLKLLKAKSVSQFIRELRLSEAMKMLRAALYQRRLEEQEAEKAKIEATKTDISWGNQIRSYVFQPYTMVNDHRTELKVGDVQRIMDGDLDEFIQAYLKRYGGSVR